jgi:hypothetical protein
MFDTLCTYPVLSEAFRRVRRGKAFAPSVRAFGERLHENLAAIRRELLEGTYRFGDYRISRVYEPKPRLIAAAPVRDRVVHHAVILVCGERLERALIDRCYACRAGKGQWRAVEAAVRLARRSAWCLKLDIRHYFDSIDHGILMEMLRRKLSDGRLLALLEDLVGSYRMSDVQQGMINAQGAGRGRRTSSLDIPCSSLEIPPGRGLPIGNLTSQYFANLYLDPLDRLIDNTPGLSHVRYMDDLAVFGEHDALLALFRSLPAFLDARLALRLKDTGGLHRTARGVNFLGGRVYPQGAVASAAGRKRLRRKVAACERAFEAGLIGEAAFQARLRAFYAWRAHFPVEVKGRP